MSALQKNLSCAPAVNQSQTALVIATGEEQRFANMLITIGVVKTGQP